ncbi:MAG: hypothetical protein K0V04_13010 [Deltaproteobacteria bacterium]|nr:hypothetical protein [Deltaproteobacteria bacterium]
MLIEPTTSPGTRPWRVLLFVHGRDGEQAAEAIRTFEAIRWPTSCEPTIIDGDDDARVAQWYGIQRWPAVAIVHDAMLLAIEHGCTAGACARVLAAARERVGFVHRSL